MAFNVTDFQSFIRGYMIYSIKKAIPDLDISDNSGFDDLFIKPMLEVIPTLTDTINSLEFKMNLDNAQFMTETELDDIGLGNYLLARNPGSKATTSLTLSFLKINTSVNLVIPIGATFATESGVKYQTTQKYEYTPTELLASYNPSRTTYDILVPVEAMGIGTDYNVSENQIKIAVTKISSTLATVSNKTAVTSGVDKETNVDYAARIREFYISRYLGTKPGYRQYIYENFPEVEDIYIAGFGDDEMQRDYMTVLKGTDLIPMHMGGKVDIYLKGCIYKTNSLNFNVNTLKLKLTQKYSYVNISSITVDNLTDNTKVPVFVVTDESDTCIVTLLNGTEQSFDSSIISQIKVDYIYNTGTMDIPTSETFSVGVTKNDLQNPFKSILSIYETVNTANSYTDVGYYDILRTQLDGTPIVDSYDPYWQTSKEYASIKMKNIDTIINGTNLTVEYTTNQTVADVVTKFDLEENRVITTDLMFKECPPVFINVGFSVKLKVGLYMDDVKMSALNSAIIAYFDTLGLGSRVEESDIVGNIYKTSGVSEFLEYILLPLNSFYIPVNPSDDVIIQRDGTYIAVTNLQYPALNKTVITVIE